MLTDETIALCQSENRRSQKVRHPEGNHRIIVILRSQPKSLSPIATKCCAT